ncbi:MAG: T9SS type A sorting domain-containing protein, partial [candidate division KSB1 bacterium]|nr:T9SS type A sorting domain-containing protein [candidate division KSB1 bacterium]
QGITLWGYMQNSISQSTCYLVRSDGSERPAMQWLRTFLTIPGNYRSYQSGNWNDVNTWERYNGTAWVYPAPTIPSLEASVISIQKGHTVTVTTPDSVDQLVIATGGELVINPDVTLLVKNGEGVDLTLSGVIKNFGTITQENSTTLKALSGGRYLHNQDGGVIPEFQWGSGSTIEFTSLKTTAPSNGNQNFYNVIWNCPNQTANLNMGWNGNTIGGNITIISTGTGKWEMCAPPAGTTAMVTIKGNIIQSGGQFTSNGTDNPNTGIVINHYGNIQVTGGNFSVSRGSQGGSGTTVWNLHGNVSLKNATTQNSNPGGAKFVFTKDGGSQSLSFSGVTFGSGGFPVEVDSGATLDIGTSILQGDGDFHLKAGGTLMTAHVNGIDGSIANTGSKTFDKAAGYGFNGSSAQVTGSLMPDTVNTLILNNPQGVTLSNSVLVNGTLEIVNGALSLNGHVLSYGANASLKYSGSSALTTTDVEFPESGGPSNLIIANLRGVTLHASRTIRHLELSGKLDIGTNTLIASSATNTDARSFVATGSGGMLKMISVGASPVFFPVGTTSYAPVWISNYGVIDAVSVGVVKDEQVSPYGGRVKVKWNIIKDTPEGGNYTLQFGWTAQQETADFRADRAKYARIFNLTDTTEAGTGDYTTQFITLPYTISRGGITQLGPFAVGLFRAPTGLTETPEGVPLEFHLCQNYPNPFNSSTTIRFTIAKEGKVKIIVYDLLGKEVATLVDAKIEAGEHIIKWTTENLASGIYICKLITKDFVQTRKMMLLK